MALIGRIGQIRPFGGDRQPPIREIIAVPNNTISGNRPAPVISIRIVQRVGTDAWDQIAADVECLYQLTGLFKISNASGDDAQNKSTGSLGRSLMKEIAADVFLLRMNILNEGCSFSNSVRNLSKRAGGNDVTITNLSSVRFTLDCARVGADASKTTATDRQTMLNQVLMRFRDLISFLESMPKPEKFCDTRPTERFVHRKVSIFLKATIRMTPEFTPVKSPCLNAYAFMDRLAY